MAAAALWHRDTRHSAAQVTATSTGRRSKGRQARAPCSRALFLSGVFHASPRYDGTLPDISSEEGRVRPFQATTLPAREVHRPFNR
jgi:hypothetical protein